MARDATPGEMRTRIRILKPKDNKDSRNYRNTDYVNIYDDNRTIRCKWISAFGLEAVQAYSMGLTDPATVTMRYDPRVTGDCIVEKLEGSHAVRYRIISKPNDVGDAHRWLEFKVTRRGAAV